MYEWQVMCIKRHKKYDVFWLVIVKYIAANSTIEIALILTYVKIRFISKHIKTNDKNDFEASLDESTKIIHCVMFFVA